MDFDTLTAAKTTNGSIARWLNTSEVDAEEIIGETEDWLAQRLRVRRMQERTTTSLSEGESELDLASSIPDFLDPLGIRIQGQGMWLRFVAEDMIDDLRGENEDGELSETTPSAFTIIGNTIYFDVTADDDYTLIVVYYARPPALSDSQQTNLYTEQYRPLFKAAAMGFGYVFLKDEARASQMFQSAESHIAKCLETDDLVRRGQVIDVRTPGYE
jgi:hypothetical protein